jgi:hypothetical protein
VDEWINRILSSVKEIKKPAFLPMWMNLEDMLNEVSLAQKDKYHMMSLVSGT